MKKLLSRKVVMRAATLLIVLLPFYALAAPSVRIISDAYENKVEVGESFHITIEATDCTSAIDVAKLPPGVKVVYNTTSQTSKVSVENGKRRQTHTTSMIWTCKGQIPGQYTFGPVTVDGCKSNTISYKVVAADPGKSNQNKNTVSTQSQPINAGPLFIGKGNEEMYLRASVNKTTAYEQEAIEYIVKLYTTYGDIKFLGAAAAPKFEGFVVEESDDVSKSFSFEDINGQTFKTAIIARYIIFPQKAGKLRVTGNTYTVSTDARQYYHDPYFQTITVKQPVQLNVTPNDIVIDVKDLPLPVPSNFTGGVGQFKVSSSLSSPEMTTNSASTLNITIEGKGNIQYVKIPDLSAFLPSSFEIYTPVVDVSSHVSQSNVEGTSRFEYSIIPREAGNFIIPKLDLVYFDPSDGSYKTMRTDEYNVIVSMGQTSSKSQQALTFNSNLLPIGVLGSTPQPYVNGFLYWLWYIIPVIVFVIVLGVYRQYMRERDDMILFRSKNANKMALKRLSAAYQCIKDKKESQFYDEMLQALWGYLADKLKIPTSALNRSNVSEEFKKHGVKESTFMPIINLIDECEYAKYTPVAREANMRQLYTDAVESLSKVEREYEDDIKGGDDDGEEDNAGDDSYVNSLDATYSLTSDDGKKTKEDKEDEK